MKRILIIILLLGSAAAAQNWSGVLSTTRATDWSQAGVVGGIPSGSWTQCGSTIAAGASTATIQNAINACAANHYVLLGAGTFNGVAGLNMKTGVELRGMGANQTFIVFASGAANCNGGFASICFLGDNVWVLDSRSQPGGTQAANWTGTNATTGTYTQGATSVRLTSVGSNGVRVGTYLYLDQADDTSPGANFFTCETTGNPGCSLEGSPTGAARVIGGIVHDQMQVVRVTAIPGGCGAACTGAGPFDVTITPGIYAPNYATGKSPGAWWASSMITNSGVRNLSMNTTAEVNGTDTKGVIFDNAANCWFQGVRHIRQGGRSNIQMTLVSHLTIADNYFFSNAPGASQNYNLENFNGSDVLEVNNIFHNSGVPFMGAGPTTGFVFAYNYSILLQATPVTYNSQMIWEHNGGVEYNLFEGNVGSGMVADTYHGNSLANTAFRNRFSGRDSPAKNINTTAVEIWSYSRYHNIVGNVLGLNGVTSTYTVNPGAQEDGAIYAFGASPSESTTVANDSLVGTTVMRWGNWDNVNNANRFVNGEVPSGISPYPNAVPASQVLPASFYLSSQPSTWWGVTGQPAIPWPPIGPDVTGGTFYDSSGSSAWVLQTTIGGHANLIPAMSCYKNVMNGPADGSGSVLSFNANSCYTAVAPMPPLPPTGIKVVIQ